MARITTEFFAGAIEAPAAYSMLDALADRLREVQDGAAIVAAERDRKDRKSQSAGSGPAVVAAEQVISDLRAHAAGRQAHFHEVASALAVMRQRLARAEAEIAALRAAGKQTSRSGPALSEMFGKWRSGDLPRQDRSIVRRPWLPLARIARRPSPRAADLPGLASFRGGRAYVVAAHYPSGGGRMLYGIAEVLATEFGAEVIVVDVGGEAHAPDRFGYPLALPSIDVDGYRAAAREDDLLVMSPAFSHLWLGRTAPRRKLMYLQHFNTFRVLDTFFSDYVCVSRHTRDMLRATYGIRAQVIPAFIEPVAQAPPDWTERPDGRVLVNLKGDRGLNTQLLEEIRSGLAARGVAAEFVDPVQGGVPHAELMRTLGNHRYLLTLTESEGFGLLPLEAMARGVAVVGFDGFGGRDYMRPGRNSLCHPFPQVDRVIDSLTLLLTDASRARAIALAGQQTARGFNRARFRSAWHRALDALVQ